MCVLDAHQVFFDKISFFKLLLIFISSFSDCENLRFPKSFIFFTPNFSKYFFDSLLATMQRSKQEKIFLEKFENIFHLLKLFFVILPFIKVIGIFFFFKFKYIFGQISESIKKADEGFQ